ncbi:MAG: hypothetical protein WC322_06950 [Candidatus Paceibacterota bacterium]|jgi:hypothetical protein
MLFLAILFSLMFGAMDVDIEPAPETTTTETTVPAAPATTTETDAAGNTYFYDSDGEFVGVIGVPIMCDENGVVYEWQDGDWQPTGEVLVHGENEYEQGGLW